MGLILVFLTVLFVVLLAAFSDFHILLFALYFYAAILGFLLVLTED